MKKRLTALLLLVCMLLTMVPMGAWAEETGTAEEPVVVNEPEPEGDNSAADPEGDPPAAPDPCQNGHTWGAWQSDGEGTGTHSRECSVCQKKEEHVPCSGGTATCTMLAVCKDCGASYGDYQHAAPVYQNVDGTNTHKIICSSCSKLLGTETCTFSAATCKDPAKCTKCHVADGDKDPTNHAGGTHAVQNAGTETHNVVCDSCGKAIDTNIPCTSDGKADCQHKAKCTVCGGEVGELGGHVIKDHPATCLKAAVCDVCGKAVGDPLGHDGKPCKRENCDCPHEGLWASDTPGTCKECGKTFDKTSVDVTFTVTGYGIGKPISGLTATASDSHVKNVKATAQVNARAAGKFEEGTSYTITVTYDVDPGFTVGTKTLSVNGKTQTATGTDSSVSFDLSTYQPETVYTITYKGTDGATVKGTLVTEYTASSPTITLPDLEKTGYTFNGWTGNGIKKATKGLTIPTGTKKNLTYTASFTANKYTVTFDLDGRGKNFTQTVEHGKKCPTPKTPTARNEIFDCWKKSDGSKYDFSQPVTGDFTLTATWKPGGYIYYHNASGEQIYEAGKTVKLPKPTKSGYYFCGWFTTSNFKSGTQVTTVKVKDGQTVDVYAKWKKVDPTNPKTGDTAYPELALGILALSAVSLGAVTVVSKKKRLF